MVIIVKGMIQKNVLVLLAFLLLSASIWTSLAFASSSGSKADIEDEQQSQVTWKNFKDRNNLFSVQYPSNWTPTAPAAADARGPIDSIFYAPVSADELAQVEFFQYAQPSVFTTPKESLESEISTNQNDPTTTKFEIERPIECQKYTLNGLQACSYIYETHSTPESGIPNQAILAVDALADDGTEYETYYYGSYDLFEHFLPVAENMIKTFQTTGSNTSTSDFSLSGSSNTTGQLSTNSSSEDDFSLG